MSLTQIPPLWSGDPLCGVIVWGTGGVIAWTLLAALVGCFLCILRESGHVVQPVPHPPVPTPGSRRPRLAYT